MNAAIEAVTRSPAGTAAELDHPASIRAVGCTQVVLVMQGGGALGAYQGGVYQALDEAGIAPDWVIGTSIGAINAGLIAGNAPADRLPRMVEFWNRVRRSGLASFADLVPAFGGRLATAMTVAGGVSGFFRPNPLAQMHLNPLMAPMAPRLTPETAGYYSTEPLAATLADLIDMERLNRCETRLTVGAANVRTGEMTYFDSRDQPIGIRHIMASGALPPAFPAVAIDGELYWDGGIISNTPVEAVLDDSPRRSSLVFSVHMWRPHGPDPDTMQSVMGRHKDLQYASRTQTQIRRQKQVHRLRHIISELGRRLPDEARSDPAVAELLGWGCTTRMHVVRLVAPPLAGEDHAKDIDFSAEGIRQRWEAGLADTRAVIAQRPWTHAVDPIEGFVLHEADAGRVTDHS